MNGAGWREAQLRLAGRVAAIPAALRALAGPPPPAPFDPRGVARVWTTGLGSSAVHARLLAAWLDEAELPARFVPTGALAAGPPAGAGDAALVVFSQGLSPNARLALADATAWRHVCVVTALDTRDAARRRRLDALHRAGVALWPLPGADEDGLLLRVVGPAAGLVSAAQLAARLGAPLAVDAHALAGAAERSAERARGVCEPLEARDFSGALLIVAGGLAAERADGLRHKLLEGLQRPVPPVCEVLELSHGPFQALFEHPATLLALAQRDAPQAAALLARVPALLDPGRHRLLTFEAETPGPLALLEHELALDVFVLRGIEVLGLDAARWPGRGREGPLYDLGLDPEEAVAPAETREPGSPAAPAAAPGSARLEELTWPEVAARLAGGGRVAVLALGSTEQHGPHLPLATDTWIAEALAARFCARVPGAVALPAVPFGCASEHLGFPGTLHVEADTLRALLRDLVVSAARHGFEEVFCFSAHGGNLGCLRELAAGSVEEPGTRLVVFTDHARLGAALAAVGRDHGVAPEAAGLHAGELESSIVARLRPGALRSHALAPGLCTAEAADALFYPDLRARAPDGTVGDPRGATPDHAEPYLAAWADVLVEAFREARAAARKRASTKGTKQA